MMFSNKTMVGRDKTMVFVICTIGFGDEAMASGSKEMAIDDELINGSMFLLVNHYLLLQKRGVIYLEHYGPSPDCPEASGGNPFAGFFCQQKIVAESGK